MGGIGLDYRVGDGFPTGDAVFVRRIEDLANFKSEDLVHGSGGVYKINFPLVFTHRSPADLSAPMDFGNCRIEVDGAAGGSLHGFSPTAQQLTASGLDPAVPFVTCRGTAVMRWISVAGVGIALDLDGTASGPGALSNISGVLALFCGALGTISNYAGIELDGVLTLGCGSLIFTDVGTILVHFVEFRAMTGGVELRGAMRTATLNPVRFEPLVGVTALTVPADALFAETLDFRLCIFVLDTPTSQGLAVHEDVELGAEALDLDRVVFTTTAGGDPIGIPIPSGYLNWASLKAHFERCIGTDNSSSSGYYTTSGNTEITPNAVPGTPTVAILTPPAGAVDIDTAERFTISDAGRVTYIGGVPIRGRATWIMSIAGQANKEAMAYVGVGSTGPVPVAAHAVLKTGVPAPLNVGGNATSITVIHEFKMSAGDFAEPWIDADAGDTRVASIKAFVDKVAG